MDHDNDSKFEASVKGLYFNNENKLLMMLEDTGLWEIPGGRVQNDEDLQEALVRECTEETGLECEILEERPLFVYSAPDYLNRARIMIFYRVNFKSLDFTPTNECIEIKFYTLEEVGQLKKPLQLKRLPEFLEKLDFYNV